MTFYEYELRMKAYQLQMIDQEYRIHRLAWVNREVKAEKKTGKNKTKPVYSNFKDFFDYEKLIDAVLNDSVEDTGAASGISKRAIEYMERRKMDGKL